ncbi:MAG: hypothetical protein HY815_11285 [Candidatus Riflebacteria bacterium]|nr:hypothetical protein [Candidatus Riflebacteria bacterium]
MNGTTPSGSVLERRTLWLSISLTVLVLWWTGLVLGWKLFYPGGFGRSVLTLLILPLWWTGLTILYAFDRGLRFRLLYEGALASVAYFLVHDIPARLGSYPYLPFGAASFYGVLLLTGFLAAVPFGRRGAGVAAVAGALLSSLWLLYRVLRPCWPFSFLRCLDQSVVPGLLFITLGGLLGERFTRLFRKEGETSHPQPLLWGIVVAGCLVKLISVLAR